MIDDDDFCIDNDDCGPLSVIILFLAVLYIYFFVRD